MVIEWEQLTEIPPDLICVLSDSSEIPFPQIGLFRSMIRPVKLAVADFRHHSIPLAVKN